MESKNGFICIHLDLQHKNKLEEATNIFKKPTVMFLG